jgi:prepilin-type processing-associated H-X9-DG protein
VNRGDYAANAGGMLNKQTVPNNVENSGGPDSYSAYDAWSKDMTDNTGGAPCYTPSSVKYATGVVYQRSMIRAKDILDGQSKTYAVGEKFALIDQYGTGDDPADNEYLFVGYDNDTNRSSQPMPNAPTIANVMQDDRSTNTFGGLTFGGNDAIGRDLWGSAHRNTFNMVFVDGSVHSVPYNIDVNVHMQLANRMDGKTPKFDF